MAAIEIIKGENVLIRRNLFESDGVSELNIADLSAITARLRRYDKLGRYILPDPLLEVLYPSANLRDGLTANQIEFELLPADTEVLPTGTIVLEFQIEAPDIEFTTYGSQVDIAREDLLITSQ